MRKVISSVAANRPLDAQLERVIEGVIDRLEEGLPIDVDALADEYPQFAQQLRELLPLVAALVDIGGTGADNVELGLGESSFSQHLGSRQLGDFQLIRELGRGGMGTVFEAEQRSMGRRVALKVLPFASLVDDKTLQRFRNEVRAAATLDHPNIVSIYSVGEERGVHYFAMQLIRGWTVADMIAMRRGRHSTSRCADDSTPHANLSDTTKRIEQARIGTVVDPSDAQEYFRRVARLAYEVAQALQHAHELGVIHRDIKPSNLLLDSQGRLYVSDFGLARIESEAGITVSGDIVGTLRYMSPEQATGNRAAIDQRGDIYSLGATLYELLTLQPAFGNGERGELLREIAHREPTTPRKLDPRIPTPLETIALKAMAKDRDERYQSASALACDLLAFIEHRAIAARPPSLIDRIARWSRRHTLAACVTVGILLLVAVGATVASVLVWQANRRTSAALDEAKLHFLQAEQSRNAAQASARESQAVTSFFTETLLGSAQPRIDQRSDLTVKNALALAEQSIEAKLVDQPNVVVAVRVAIGRTYQSLGEFELAEHHLNRACEVAAQHLDPTSEQALRAVYERARFWNIAGRRVEAKQALEQVLAAITQHLGADHVLAWNARYQLANNAIHQGNYDLAVDLHKQVVQRKQKDFGKDNPATLPFLGDLATAYTMQGDYANAELVAQELLAHARRLLDPEDLRLVQAEQTLARIPSPDRGADDVRQVRERVLKTIRRAYGETHYKTIEAKEELAKTYRELGRDSDASRLRAEFSKNNW